MTLHGWRDELTAASRATGTRFTSVISASPQAGRPTLHRGQAATWHLACHAAPTVTATLFDERTGQLTNALHTTSGWWNEAVSVTLTLPQAIRPGPYCVVFEGNWSGGGRAGAEVGIDVT